MTAYRLLALVTLALTFVVVSVGAYVRLADAGLGCPDWPGCYGHLTPHHAADKIAAAHAADPAGPVSPAKAWKEMVHRYLAGVLGVLILFLAMLAWLRRGGVKSSPVLPTLLLAVVVFQAALGMWTVTWLLKPAIVTAHLLGGMATLGLLVWLWRREGATEAVAGARRLRGFALLALALVAAQIALGGWVSTNYAALACTDFPLCQGQWVPEMDFEHALTLRRALGETADGELLPFAALTAIHWMHRVGALVLAVFFLLLVARLARVPGWAGWAAVLGGLFAVQVSLGIANVWMSLPLALAVAHNAGAAALLAAVVGFNERVWRG